MIVTIQLPDQEPRKVEGRLAEIYFKLLKAAELIERLPAPKITIHCGAKPDDVSVEVPVRY